ALRHRVHTRRCARGPSTRACTRCRLGRLRFFVLLLAWLTWLPVSGPLPHTSHLNAIGSPTAGNGGKYPPSTSCQVAATCLRPLSSRAWPAQARAASSEPSSPKPG